MSSLSEEANVSTVCSKMLSVLSSQTARDNDSHFWFYATAVVELAHMNMSFAERYWDVSMSGFRQKIVSFPLTTCRDEEGKLTLLGLQVGSVLRYHLGELFNLSKVSLPNTPFWPQHWKQVWWECCPALRPQKCHLLCQRRSHLSR